MQPAAPHRAARLPSVNFDDCGEPIDTAFVKADGSATPDWLKQAVLVLLFGVSAHATKNAFAPAQPELERAGLSPCLYALLAVSPIMGCLFLPFVWGVAYKDHEARVLVAVPAGQLLGQLMVAAGLFLVELPGTVAGGEGLMLAGLLLFSACHGGAHVVQCAVLARALPEGLTTGFVATVACTHMVAAVCNFLVPRILAAVGIFGVQLALLVPGIVSAVAGHCLAKMSHREEFAVPHLETPCPSSAALPRRVANSIYRRISEPVVPDDSPSFFPSRSPAAPPKSVGCFGGMGVIWYIGVWKGLFVGTLMSFRTIQNELLVRFYNLSIVQAGSFVGTIEMVSLLLLPSCGFLFEFVGRSTLILFFSGASIAAALVICGGPVAPEAVWMGSFLLLAVAGTMVPVLAQALVPDHSTRSMGRAFGVLEIMLSSAQIGLTLLIGVLRQRYGSFDGALAAVVLALVAAGICSVLAVSSMAAEHPAGDRRRPLLGRLLSGGE